VGVHEYQNHFNHLKTAVFDERYSIHGSTNLNYRSLEDDKDFEMVVLVDDEDLARTVVREVRDRDLHHCHRFTPRDDQRSLRIRDETAAPRPGRGRHRRTATSLRPGGRPPGGRCGPRGPRPARASAAAGAR
jgi:phosphatidylserine/phosphatidylglycerophosphate/cardiolipin synthase-like enzyme